MKNTFKSVIGASAFLITASAWAQPDQPRDTMQRNETDNSLHEQRMQHETPVEDRRMNEKRADTKKDQAAKAVAKKDKEFIDKAGVAGLAEVEMGKLALKNGASKGVRDFGQTLIDDHSKANRELEQIAVTLNATVPTAVDAEHQRHLDMLSAMRGVEFDTSFSKHMVDGHQKVIAAFKAQSETGESPALRTFATATLPTLRKHLKIAQDLARAKTSTR